MSGLLDAIKCRQKILDDAKVSNEEAQALLRKAIEKGHHLTLWTKLHGPYTEIVTYWMSDGTVIEMTGPASLHWVPLDIIGPY
jgi:hypothetical protein